MNLQGVQKVVDAVLYEGYILYPYRPTSTKNRQRWTFGGIYPPAYTEAGGGDSSHMQTQCLLEGDARTRLQVRVRFLHPLAREVGAIEPPLAAWPAQREPEFRPVPSLELGGRTYYGWQEAMERDVSVCDCEVGELLPAGRVQSFAFAGRRESVPLADGSDRIGGVLVHRQQGVSGRVGLCVEPVTEGVYRLTVRVDNRTPMDPAIVADREEASLYSFASTHIILGADGGAFVSLMDPPPPLEAAAKACDNLGAWPVLVGEPGARDTLLASPIILYDYPEIAPESAGDLFDATEIDEILSLRILAMTDAEKREMAAADPRAAELLGRTEALDGEDFLRMHGTLREVSFPDTSSTGPDLSRQQPSPDSPRLVSYRGGGLALQVGDRVRLHPKAGGDVMDLVLDGRTAEIEAIERDFEDRVHVAVVLDDDPGRELGVQRMPGHRFFFSPEEIERLDAQPGREAQA